jgi:tRNA(fMet)-specific endonuclease VapC
VAMKLSLDYAKAKLDLRRKGRPIPENDRIGAFSIAYGLTLAARDAHFDEIRELSVERW